MKDMSDAKITINKEVFMQLIIRSGKLFKIISLTSLAVTVAFILGTATAQSQPSRGGYGYHTGPGYGYGMEPGMMAAGWIDVPAKLPAPKSMEWSQKLRDILMLERGSLDQFGTDQEKFNAYMPYVMVIPQKENHVEWIEQLFRAYGLPSDYTSLAALVDNKTLTSAYELSAKMENDLLPRYEWLVKKAEDRDTARVLNTILIQSRWHLVMFDHALRMGHGYGFSRGWGMGRGMMGGYGIGPGRMGSYFGTGLGYEWQYPLTGKAINAKEAEAMMNDYLKSSRNPNLKLGKIKDVGMAFEAEILTKKNDLVDKVHIDKATGYIRSAY
jgi:hypothetical protein